MPIVNIDLLEGRSIEQKSQLIKAVSNAIADSIDVPIERVHVILRDMSPHACGNGGKTVAEQMAGKLSD